ncbi:MAG: oligosaccharide flippase family protein [Hyphomicrobiales bacterium]|nr:oligosaccharide flippase family protein [Hyphomicrobiales bacterium]
MAVRRALMFSSVERYVNLVVNFTLIAAVSRLLTPAEIGVAALGVLILGLVEVLRDIPSSYLVQRPTLSREDIRTAFTAMFILSLALTGGLAAAAPAIAAFYGDPGITLYLQLLAVSFLAGPVERPLMALFRREMRFGAYAVVSMGTVLVNAVVTLALAAAGYGYLSFAWAAIAAGLASTVIALSFRPDFWIFKPCLVEWRQALHFGSFTTGWALITRSYDLLPYTVLGRVHQLEATGFFNRTVTVAQAPDKLILSGLASVIFPAFAMKNREGHSLREPFLKAFTYITALYWPAFLLLALLAYPAVAILLGPQWREIAPLVQATAIAHLLNFMGMLTYPALMAIGAMRALLMTAVACFPFAVIIAGLAAWAGLKPLIYSLLLTMPGMALVNMYVVKRHLGFGWIDVAKAAAPSAAVTAGAIAPALALVIGLGWAPFSISIGQAAIVALVAGVGWIAAAWALKHPLWAEAVAVAGVMRARARGGSPAE